MTKDFNDFGFDYESEFSDLSRRQKLLDVMQGSLLQPMRTPEAGRSGSFEVAAKIHPLEAATRVLQGYMVGQQNKSLAEERSALQSAGQQELKDSMTRYYEASQTDPRGALLNALTEKHPLMRQFALEQLKGQGGKREVGEVNGILYDKNTLETLNLRPGAQPSGDGNLPGVVDGQSGPGWKTVNINGDLYQQTSTGLKKLDNAAKMKVAVNASPIIQGQREGYKAMFGEGYKVVNELGKQAKSAADMDQALAELKALHNKGIYSNVTTGPVTYLQNLGQAMGVEVDPKKLARTETYNAVLTDLWQGAVAKYGGNRGVTKEEAEEIKTLLPQSAKSPEAREQLFKVFEKVNSRKIGQFKSSLRQYNQAVRTDDPTILDEKFFGVYNPEPNSPDPAMGDKGPIVKNW